MKIKLGEAKDVSTKVAPNESLRYQTDTPTKAINLNSDANPADDLRLMFDYETSPVRIFFDNSGIWFVLKDVCDILGIKNPRKVWNRLDEDERGVHKGYTPGGLQDMQYVNEPGLYDTIIRSNSEKAKPFRRWVTHEVLPSIRKQGYYSTLSDIDLLNILADKCIETGNTDRVLERFSKKSIKDACYSKRYGATLKLLAEVKKYTWRDEFIAEYTRIWNGDTVGSNRYCRKVLKAATQLPMKPYGWKQQ